MTTHQLLARPLRLPAEACAAIDELGPDATGELVVESPDGPRGSVFVESGRICWAAAAGLAPRLTELLAARANLSAERMEALFRKCRAERLPIGEHLVECGALSADDLRSALLQHTLESMARLCSRDAEAAFVPRAGKGYRPKFTFATLELVAALGAQEHAAVAADVRVHMRELLGDGIWSAAYVRPPTVGPPRLVVFEGSSTSVRSILGYGKWGATMLDVAGALDPERPLVCATREVQGVVSTLVLFARGPAFVVAETGPHGLARVLARRARAQTESQPRLALGAVPTPA